MSESFEQIKDALPTVLKRAVSLINRLWSGDDTRVLTVKSLTSVDPLAGDLAGDIKADDGTIVFENGTDGTDATATLAKMNLSLTAGVTVGKGELAWNADEETFDFGMNGAVWQAGLENYFHAKNNTGTTLRNGRPMMAGGSSGATGLIYAVPMDGTNTANAKFLGGLATSDILPGGVGKVTNFGKVRDIDTTGGESFGGLETWVDNDLLFIDPVNVGYLTNVVPVPPSMYLSVCLVVYAHATEGSLLVRITAMDQSVLRTSSAPLVYNSPLPERNAQENIFGSLAVVSTANNVNAGDVTLVADTDWGLGKMVIVSNGIAETGTITVTGTVVDRDTGVETALGVSEIVIDTTTTDANSVDANSQTTYSLTDAYMTDKWFTGTVNIVISQTAGSLTDLDIYACAFDQFGDVRSINVKSLTMTLLCSTGDAGAKLSAHIYTVQVTGDKVNILPMIGGGVVRTSDFVTDKWYRFRRGHLDIQLDGTTDGVFANVSFLGSPAKFKDASVKIWADIIP